ncbi:MAG: hypothetical protein H0Z34_13790 [Brevibacillus sp.]|nr:hypothetical protein [Brevibacillus sp.]
MLESALMIYYLLACLYVALLLQQRNQFGSGLAAIACLIPFAGLPLAVIAGRAGLQAGTADTRRFAELTEVTGTVDVPYKVDMNKELAIVPLEEALVINDYQTRRRILLDALKHGSHELISFLSKAVRNEDTETSHYAVTALVELKREMMGELQRWSVSLEKHPNDLEVLTGYANALRRYLGSGLMDANTERAYRLLQADVLQKLTRRPDCGEKVFQEKIECELALSRYDAAEDTCKRFLTAYPQSEAAYVMAMKLYYTIRAGNKFELILKRLKHSSVKVSPRTLQLIRYWSRREEDEQ